MMANKRRPKRLGKPLNTIDKILIFCATLLILFTITMIVIFCFYQCVPDTLIGVFFGAFSVETVNCVMLYKDKNKRGE